MKFFTKVKLFTEIVIIEEDEKIISVDFNLNDSFDLVEKETPLLKEAKNQLLEYYEGKRKVFDLPIAQVGTSFQKAVWDYLEKITYGKVVTYKDVALAINHPKAFRAVGMACNRNAIPIIIPCHRVVGSNKSLVGYAGGLDIKEKLLKLENR